MMFIINNKLSNYVINTIYNLLYTPNPIIKNIVFDYKLILMEEGKLKIK